MKQFRFLIATASLSVFLISCKKTAELSSSDNDLTVSSLVAGKSAPGNVYTLSNQAAANSVIIFSRSADGSLSYAGSVPTGGTGTGAGLGTQGAIVLSEDHSVMVAVNAGSNSISSITGSGTDLHVVSTVSSGGTRPGSVTIHGDLVYVLNIGGTGNISGFRLQDDGSLVAIANSTRPLSSMASGPAQVSFVADGTVLAITEKATNKIITYKLNAAGLPTVMHSITAAHPTPFGFAAGNEGYIYVSEAAGGAANASAVSSYQVSNDGSIRFIDGPNMAGQSAACWVVINNNNKYLYATNTASNNVTSFSTGSNGAVSVLGAIAAVTGNSPTDAALSNNSKFLYVLNSQAVSLSVFAVENDGSLTSGESVGGLMMGTVGVAAK